MLKAHVLVAMTVVSCTALADEVKVENSWVDTPAVQAVTAPPAKVKEKKAKKSKPKIEAKATAVETGGRSPASSPDANKVIPSPLQLPTAIAAPAPSAPLTLPGSLKFSGFADFRYTAFSAPNDPNVTNPHAESGFGIEDGALAAVYDIDKLSFTADIAVRRMKDFDQSSGATIPNQSSTDRLNFGADGSELYLKYKADDHWTFDMGQYFAIYGSESPQSRNRTFSKGSLLSSFLPSVQTGFMTEYAIGSWSAKADVTNPNARGTYGTSKTGDENTEYGGAFGYSNETIQTQLGYLTRPINTADGLSRGDRTVIDMIAGLTLGAFSGSAEAIRIDDPSKNTLTPDNASDHERAGFGYLGLANYKFNEKDLIGVRYEKMNDDPGGTGLNTAESYGLSVHHRLHQNIDLSSEFNFYNYQAVSGSTWKDTLFNIGAIVSF